jgi:basic membrane protein A and related proteins
MKSRFWLVISMLLVVSVILAACAPAAEEVDDDVITAALLTPNPLGDRSFIDSAARGIEQANAELPVDAVIIETQGVAEHESALRSAIAQGYDIVLPLAWDAELLLNIAAEFPEQMIASPSEVFVAELPDNLIDIPD